MRDPIDSQREAPAEADDHASDRLAALRSQVRRLERGEARVGAAGLDLGCPVLAEALPEEGLALGRVHEVVGEAWPEVRDAAAFAFTAAILARLMRSRPGAGPVLWCPRPANVLGGGLHARGLAGLGLDPDRLILVDVRDEAERLWAMEEALATEGVLAVVAELDPPRASGRRDAATAGRRLQLAAERSGVTGFLLRPRMAIASGEAVRVPCVVETRWRVTSAPSPLSLHDTRPVWSVHLERARRGRKERAAPWRLVWDADACALFDPAFEPALRHSEISRSGMSEPAVSGPVEDTRNRKAVA